MRNTQRKISIIKNIERHKILYFLIYIEVLIIAFCIFISKFININILHLLIMIATFFFFMIYIYPWKFEVDKTRMFVLCLCYLVFTIFPALIPAITLAGIYNFSLATSVILAAFLIVFALSFHGFSLHKELKTRENTDKIRILEKIKTATGLVLPIFSLVVVFRFYYVKSIPVAFMINAVLLFLTIISIYKGIIELIIYNIKNKNK